MPRPILSLALLLFATTARSEVLPTLPLRELTIRADVVVRAQLLDSPKHQRFRVVELLKGSTPRPGTEIEPVGIDAIEQAKDRPDWNQVDGVLLFLRPDGNGSGRFPLVESGIRLHTRDRTVWWPVQPENPGPYRLVAIPGASWDAVLQHVRSDAAELNRLLAAREIADPIRRDRALLEWIDRHRNEFSDARAQSWIHLSLGGDSFAGRESEPRDLDRQGWGELQVLAFTWILRGRIPGDCWRAVNLYSELHEGANPAEGAVAFARPEGRAFLLAVARNPHQLDGARRRALKLLADKGLADEEPANTAERKDIVEGLASLLKDPAPARRGLAALALRRQANGDSGTTKETVLKALAAAYKAEPPGPVRNAFAEALFDLGGPKAWQQLTGRPSNLLALLVDLGLRDDSKLFFWVTLKGEPEPVVKEVPTLLLERLDEKGKVAESKKIPLPASAPPKWTEGWSGGALHVELNHTAWKPGTWRLSVVGVVNPNKTTWESEPRIVQVVVPGQKRVTQRESIWDSIAQMIPGGPGYVVVPEPAVPNDKNARKIVLDGEQF